MDAAKKVVVTAYEELPRRRPGSHGATSSTAARPKTRVPPTRAAVGGGYNRRAMLLAYAQHLRRRGGGQRPSSSGTPVLGWGEWKRSADPGTGNDGGDHKVVMGRKRSWCSRFRLWVQLWIRTFFRRVRTIRENASCKKGD